MKIRLVTLLLLTVAVAAEDRIPDNVIPISYKLTFLRDNLLNIGDFRGRLEFEFNVKTPTTVIQLHSEGLTIVGAPILELPLLTPITVRADTTLSSERVTLTFSGGVLTPTEKYKLKIEYTGIYNTFNARGFYSYQHPTQPHYIGLTQFGTTSARRAFPCLDQPDKKAPFTIQINYDADYKVHSHTIGSEVIPVPPEIVIPPTWPGQLFEFLVTKKISPHVVAWTITKHSSIPTSDLRVSVWHRETLSSTLLGVTVKVVAPVLVQLEIYLDYSLPPVKLELFAVAKTKFSGMENFGLPIFSEAAITFKEGESSSDDRQRICQLVTHEIAQQWFGDLVTPEWWDEVWLSEGFATYFEYFTLARVETAWQMDEQFVVQQTQAALQADWYSGAYTDTHAGKHRDLHPLIIPNVETKEDIERVFDFDAITLSKGASVVRMLNAILGDETFKKNLKNYLVERAEGNVNTLFLLEKMGASLSSGTLPAGLTLAQAMEKWITQTGFPEIVATRDYDAETVKLSQSQFLLPPHKTVGTPTWNVPIFWTTEKDSNPSTRNLHWLQPDVPDTNEIKLPSVTDEQWLLINKDQAGFYRVNYDQKNWQLLSESFLNLTSVSRAMLLDDALNLARGDRLDYVTALDVTELLPNETEFAPWSAALNGFSYLYDRLSNDTESREVIEKYILEKLTYIYDYIGGFDIAPGEPHIRLLMKQLILHWACRVGHVTCVRKADDLFNSWILSSTVIKTDLRRVSYCTGIQQGGSTDFMRLRNKYDTTSTDPITPDNARIVYALGCANDTEILREYLTDSLDTSGRIKTIGRQVFTAVCQNPIGVQIAFNFLITHWYQASLLWRPTTLPVCLPPSDEGVLEVSKAFSEDLAPKLNTPEQLKQLKALLEFNTLGKVREGVELAIGTLEDTLVWQENHRDEVIGAMGGNRRPPISAASPISISVILLFLCLFIKLKM